MAWNPSPKIADLRELSRKWNYDMIVVLAINPSNGRFETVSYGNTRALCNAASGLNNKINDMLARGVIKVDV